MLRITTTTIVRDLPRALSTDFNDRRWHPHAPEIGQRLVVIFEGEEIEDVCTFDVDLGFIVQPRRNEAGEVYIDHTGHRIAMRPRWGQVEVRWRSDAFEQLVRVEDPEMPAGCFTDVAAIVEE